MSAAVMPGDEGFRRIYDRLDGPGGLVERVSGAEHKIDKHEAICADRYAGISGKLKWLQWGMLALLLASLLEPRVIMTALFKQWGIEVTSIAPKKSPGG